MTLPWEIQKSHFSTIVFIHTSDYLRYLRRKQTVNPLLTTPENVTTLPSSSSSNIHRRKLTTSQFASVLSICTILKHRCVICKCTHIELEWGLAIGLGSVQTQNLQSVHAQFQNWAEWQIAHNIIVWWWHQSEVGDNNSFKIRNSQTHPRTHSLQTGASTPHKRCSKCTTEKVGEVFAGT